MSAWDPVREDQLIVYPYFIPDLVDVEAWANRAPTRTDVSPNTIQPGCTVISTDTIWLCMNVVDLGRDVDIHWVCWDRHTKTIFHSQQIFRKHNSAMWPAAYFSLDRKTNDDYCPHCHIKLEWAGLAERCSKCWWVKGV